MIFWAVNFAIWPDLILDLIIDFSACLTLRSAGLRFVVALPRDVLTIVASFGKNAVGFYLLQASFLLARWEILQISAGFTETF